MVFKKGQTPWNFGKKGIHLSPATEFKKGRVESVGIKQKRSDSLRGNTNAIGSVPWNRGKVCPQISEAKKGKLRPPFSEEWKKHMSRGTGENHPFFGKRHSEKTKIKIRAKRLYQVFPTRDTSIERAIQSELELRGIACYRNTPVANYCQADFAFPEKKVAVFADGDYWHNLPKVRERDQRINTTLREQGYLVLRYSETEIKANPIGVVDEILEVLL